MKKDLTKTLSMRVAQNNKSILSSNISSIKLLIILTSFGEFFLWLHQFLRLELFKYLLQVFILASIFYCVKIILSNSFKSFLKAESGVFKYLFYYSCLLLLYSILSSPSDIFTIIINPNALSSVLLFVVGYYSGRHLFNIGGGHYLRTAIRLVLIASLCLFPLCLIPSISDGVSNLLSRSFFIALLYFIVPPLKTDKRLLYAGVVAFIVASVQADVRTNLIFLFGIAVLLGIKSFFPFFTRFAKLIFFVAIGCSIALIFYSQVFFDFFFSLPFFKATNISDTDTRTFLYVEFLASYKSTYEFLFGRGLMGTYFSEYFFNLYGTDSQGDYYQRFNIEVGVLQIVLKCGLFYLIAYSAIIVNILFKSKRTEKLMYVVFVLFLLMFIEFWPTFSIRYYIFWVLIGYLKQKNLNYKNALRLQ